MLIIGGLPILVLVVMTVLYACKLYGVLATCLFWISIFMLAICFWSYPYEETRIILYPLLPLAGLGLISAAVCRHKHQHPDVTDW